MVVGDALWERWWREVDIGDGIEPELFYVCNPVLKNFVNLSGFNKIFKK